MLPHHLDKILKFRQIHVSMGIGDIEYVRNPANNRIQPIKQTIPHPPPFISFFSPGPVTPSIQLPTILFPVKQRMFNLEKTPATSNEVSPEHIHACMYLAHAERINAGTDRLYHVALRMAAHGNVSMLLTRISKHPETAHIAKFHEDRASFGEGYKTLLSEGFAGLALCALYRNSIPQLVSYASAAGEWGGVGIVSMLRMVAALSDNGDAVHLLTKSVIMPMVFHDKELYSFECEFFGPNELAAKMANRTVPFVPPGKISRTRFVDGEFLEHVCAVCGKECKNLCIGCKRVYYCGKECQVAAWKGGHKRVCCGK